MSSNFLQKTGKYIFKPHSMTGGVTGFKDIKFYIAMIFYMASVFIFINDPFFLHEGQFHFLQGSIIMISALIILAAVHWDIMLFGNPVGANLLLHLCSFGPFVLFLARILGNSNYDINRSTLLKSLLEDTSAALKNIGFEISSSQWLSEIISNWKCMVFLVIILAAFCFRNDKVKVGALVLFICLPFFGTIAQQPNDLIWLFGGFFCMACALALQFCYWTQYIYMFNVLKTLQSREHIDMTFLRTVVIVMSKLKNNRTLQENELISIVKSQYSAIGDFTDPEYRAISKEILKSMINEFNLVAMKMNNCGVVLYVNPMMFRKNNFLAYIAILPRVILICMISIIWLISPFDFDMLPLGVVDDITISVIAFFVTKNSLESSHD